MTNFANLELNVDTTSTEAAEKSLDRMADAGQRAEESMGSLEERAKKAGISINEVKERQELFNRTLDQGTGVTRKQQSETEKYMASLQKQVDTFGMSRAQLAAYRAQQLQFTDQQSEVVAANLLALQSFEKSGGGLEDLGLKSQRARNELGLLARDLLRGDFSQVGDRLGRFIGQSEIGIGVLLRVVGPIAAIIGGVVALGKAYNDGAKEVEAFNNAILISGNYAGQTRESMLGLARSVASAGLITIGAAKDIVRELVSSGQISSKSIAEIAGLAENFARATGRDSAKIGADLVKIFSDPAKGAEELNKQLNFLDKAQIQNLKTMMEYGREGDVQLILAQRLAERLKGVETNVGTLERAWAGIKGAASSAWDAMLNIGRPKSLEDQLRDAEAALDVARKRFQFRPNQNLGQFETAQSEVQRLRDAVQAQKDAASAAADTAEELRKQRIEAEIVKQLREEQLSAEIRLAEATNKNTNAAIEARFKLGKIIQEEKDTQLLASDLELARVRLSVNERKRGAEDLTRVEAARLQAEAVLIDTNRKARITDFEVAKQVRDMQQQAAQAAADAQSRATTAGSQLGDIADMQRVNEALRQRQKELGLTREQVDALRQSELSAAIARMELEVSQTVAGGTPEDDPYVQRLLRQIELLRERKDLEMRTDVTAERDARFDAEIEALKQARETGLLTQAEFDEEELELRTRHEAEMFGITSRAALERLRFQQMTGGQQVKFMLGFLSDMIAGAAQHNKTMFELHKALSLATAVVKGIEAVQSAFAWGNAWGGYPVGVAMASLAAVAQAINVAAIASTQYGGGGASGGLGGGASATPTQQTPIGQQAPVQVQPQLTVVQFQGTADERKLLRSFVDLLNEEAGSGLRVEVV